MISLQINVEDRLYNNAQSIVHNIGIDLSSAINLFLVKMVEKQDLPFQNENDIFYSPENQEHLREILEDYKNKRNFTPHELIED